MKFKLLLLIWLMANAMLWSQKEVRYEISYSMPHVELLPYNEALEMAKKENKLLLVFENFEGYNDRAVNNYIYFVSKKVEQIINENLIGAYKKIDLLLASKKSRTPDYKVSKDYRGVRIMGDLMSIENTNRDLHYLLGNFHNGTKSKRLEQLQFALSEENQFPALYKLAMKKSKVENIYALWKYCEDQEIDSWSFGKMFFDFFDGRSGNLMAVEIFEVFSAVSNYFMLNLTEYFKRHLPSLELTCPRERVDDLIRYYSIPAISKKRRNFYNNQRQFSVAPGYIFGHRPKFNNNAGLRSYLKIIKDKSRRDSLYSVLQVEYEITSFRKNQNSKISKNYEKHGLNLLSYNLENNPLRNIILTDLSIQNRSKKSLRKLYAYLNRIPLDQRQLFDMDILSILLYKLNKKEEAYKMVSKANDQARRNGMKFNSSLHIIRDREKNL